MANHYQGKTRLINEAEFNINELMYRSQPEISPLQEGDRVRFKQPFRPSLHSSEEWHFGIVIGLVQASSKVDKTEVAGIILYLYNPQTFVKYLDESGKQILFYFKRDEVQFYSS